MAASSINGTIFRDLNADGSQAPADAGLAYVDVSLLNAAGTVIDTTTTDANGAYSFSGLASGGYRVQVTPPSGSDFSPVGSSSSNPDSVVGPTGQSGLLTVSGSTITGVDAGLFVPVSLSGTVFTDNNDNGRVDGTDKGLAGVKVELLDAQGQPAGASAVTDSNGNYTFLKLMPGTYSVQVDRPALPPGSVFSPVGSNTPPQPTNGAGSSEANLLVNGSFDQGLTANGSFSTAKGFVGWNESVSTTATPYGSGPGNGPEIAWTNGTNAVAIDPTGATNPYAGYVAPDAANANYAGGSGNHAAFFVDDGAAETLSQTVDLQAGQTYEIGFDLNETTPGRNNPGYFQLTAAIDGNVITTAGSTAGTILTPGTWTHFADLYTPTASGPMTLTFTYSSGLVGSTLTSKDVLVDDVYVVPGQVTADLTTTSEVDSAGRTAPVTLTSGQTVGNESAGIYDPPATIQGVLFIDANADGSREAGDVGIAGKTVNLSNNGTIIGTAVTDANGAYRFTNQPAGTYTVTIAIPSGEKVSASGSSGTLLNSTVSVNGTQTVSVISGSAATVNAGVYAPGAISGTVFTDANADGTQQANETGLGGQAVNLVGPDGTTVLATTTTNPNGSYSFSGVAPGADTVSFTAPAGDRFTTPSSDPVTVTSGSAATVNAGVYAPASISGVVFNDGNDDGLQQQGDVGMADQTVQLLGGVGKTVIATTTTDAKGDYSFAGQMPGDYSVKVTAANGALFSPAGLDAALPSSDVGVTGAAAVHLVSGRAATVNAGEYMKATIAGAAFTDNNASGVRTTDDSALSGLKVTLLDGSGHATGLSTTTDLSGNYSFVGVAPGSYEVQIAAPTGSTISPEYQGIDPSLASDVDASGNSAPMTVASGAIGLFNLGAWMPASVGGTVFHDTNANGVMDATEAPVTGDSVTLLDSAGHALAATTTDNAGRYDFAGLKPGTYAVQVTDPDNSKFSPKGTAPAPAIDSAVDSGGKSAQIALISGENDATVSAGVYPAGTISSFVFLDAQCSGTYRVGDPGIAGVTVRLLDGSGNSLGQTTTTDATGHYSFAGLTAGSFEVQVIAPAGTSFSERAHASGNALVDSDVNATTGISDVLAVSAGATTVGANAGLEFNGNFAGTTPVELGLGQGYDGNSGHAVIVGAGGNLVHTGNGGNNIVILGDQASGNLVEAGGGTGTDIVTSCGPLDAQTQNATNGFLFAGGTGASTLQGEQGNTYMQGGRGNDQISAGQGVNVLSGGGDPGIVQANGSQVTGYTQGDELRIGGISTTILFQKGDGVITVDGGFRAQDRLEINGYAGGTMEKVNGEDALYLGGNDLIIFNGGASFGPSGISYSANPVATAQETVVFGADGLPTIEAVSGAVVTTAPVQPLAAMPTASPATSAPITPLPPIAIIHPLLAQPAVVVSTPPVAPVAPVPLAAPAQANDPIAMSGWNQTLVVGEGNHLISGSQGNSTVTVGNGNNAIVMKGWSNVITTGGGANTIVAGDGNETVNTGTGSDTVTLNGWSNLVIGGIGHDVVSGGAGNTYQVNGAAQAGGMDVTDFSYARNDVLDLSKMLAGAGWDRSPASLGNILQVTRSAAGDTVIGIDTAGPGGGYATVATLHGLGASSVADLQNHGAVRLS